MTKKEAIEYLKKADVTVYQEPKTKTAEALEMAIQALKELGLLEQSHKMFQKLFEVANEKKGEKNNDND